jgi:FAD/FMN-containing dehydrogenase/Fe-S oxidoreductase
VKEFAHSADLRNRIAADLRNTIQGEVRFDDGSRALYATDSSNYRQVPVGVVLPKSEEDIEKTVAIARSYQAPILARGGGTSLAGQCCNVAIIIDTSKYLNRIISIDPDRKIAHVQPGVVLDHLRNAAEKYRLTFGPDPATHSHCTLGGMIGNNSCGVHSVYSGKTEENVHELEILTYNGLRMRVGKNSDEENDIYHKLRSLRDRYSEFIRTRYPNIPRRVSGYNLPQLLPENNFHVARALVGSEGTCVVVLNAAVHLVHSPPHRILVAAGYSDIAAAADHVPEVLRFQPLGLEAIDGYLVSMMKKKNLHPRNVELLPEGNGWLLIEFGGDTEKEALDKANALESEFIKTGQIKSKIFTKKDDQVQVWVVRESALGATAFVPGEPITWEGWEDAAVPPEKLGQYLRDFRKLLDRYEYNGSLYGHFGQGCVHTRLNFDLFTKEGIKKYRSFVTEAADLVIMYGGSLSGEHGDGQSRGELLSKMFGPELVNAFREFKAIWDPDGKMNPGKVVDPYRLDENLRHGDEYQPSNVKTEFVYPQDGGNFVNATLRCVGVGKCRRTEGGTMCPSYMVTAEEKHSTRGRARLLFEMMHGEVLKNGWRDPDVKEALDLCLACKGCKRECPVEVDMATYKAEFFSHYYQGRLRPLSAYSMGMIYRWARMASLAPGIVNQITQNSFLSTGVKILGGIAKDRKIPLFARETFTKWFEKHPSEQTKARSVVLWPDTFNNNFYPETLKASVFVLEKAGYHVQIPSVSLCCGRPLYDYGMLGLAKKQLQQVLSEMADAIKEGTPVIVIEPSCAAVFKDEMLNLFPDDERAKKLHNQIFLLADFLQKNIETFSRSLKQKAILHGHCHQRAIFGIQSETNLLSNLGFEVEIPDPGCCGMAGSFGFEKKHYVVSRAIGERLLLPAVRNAAAETMIIASGFSCREQIAQSTSRHAMHLAEVLKKALEQI